MSTKTKVKVLTAPGVDDLETVVNAWLTENVTHADDGVSRSLFGPVQFSTSYKRNNEYPTMTAVITYTESK